jgi:hypothetical protein
METQVGKPIGLLLRLAALAAGSCALVVSFGAIQATACTPGQQDCPVVLTLKPGASVVEATGSVSAERPDYYFTFVAIAGQTITLHTVGGGLKMPIPIEAADGTGDDIDEDTPYALRATGAYVILLHANTMSSGPFGRFELTLTIK